ncbi:hypothetical protein [Clostridium sp. B9]|uniref:hypothetical protein n=1 Tax=Clostridium sp. B9 TaxID=3423224 RepID=UPI003D2ECC6B
MGILAVLAIVAFIVAAIFIEVFCTNKNFSELMLISIEITLIAVVVLLFRDNSSSNFNFYLGLLGGSIFLIGLTVNLYGIIKHRNKEKLKDNFS